MSSIPEALQEVAEFFDLLQDRNERIEALMALADRFEAVPAEVATRPYPESNKVEGCESQAYGWGVRQPDETLRYYFAVENPQGIAAMSLAVILEDNLSGAPLSQILTIPPEIIYRFFGRELSVAKSVGLMGMIELAKRLAREEFSGERG